MESIQTRNENDMGDTEMKKETGWLVIQSNKELADFIEKRNKAKKVTREDIDRNMKLTQEGEALDVPLVKLDGCLKKKLYIKLYLQSDEGKAVRKKYQQSDKYKAYRREYQKSDKYKAYLKSEKHKAYQRAYNKAYYQRKKEELLK